MTDYTLVFPHQLFDPNPAVAAGRAVLLVEDSLFFGDRRYPARFHRQKLFLHRASMAEYAKALERKGHRVETWAYRPAGTAREVVGALAAKGARVLHIVEPEDFLLEKRMREGAAQAGVELRWYRSPMFLADPAWADGLFAQKKRYRMADFYQAHRTRMNLLMDGDLPRGGRWSFDNENRKPLPRGLVPPPVYAPRPAADRPELARQIDAEFPEHPGDASACWFPVTRAQARKALDDFLSHRLAQFGDYEDAISSRHDVLYHAVLTPALNIGLLTPDEVVRRALDCAAAQPIPLNSLEGFIRQIIGWREFIRLMYRREGVRMRRANFWGHERLMPRAFYSGETGLPPFDLVVRRVHRRAWCHHIERLMVASNLMLLCGIRPDDAYRWFMELFIDAYDWVMVPNVYGMGLFADGGLFATKPYISSSAYLRRMGDFEKGPWCNTWDGLFWSFIGRNRDYFIRQPRLSMMARSWDKLGAARQREHRRRADAFLDRLT